MNTCFYLLTVNHFTNKSGQGGTSADTLGKFLFDINDGEQYGEYRGPAAIGSPEDSLPSKCRIEELYCSSEGEWQVLAMPYMHE